eukprot:TRINITY_DN16206_c0_g2_i3.p1 TRINITY_DN16206_c0_g2~~TRINITY_DN16206_c0_g2_i3.p1  ORF type:complete len:1473 (+),score=364.10 TRINITY_DN16206_c0_g2_i3:67-4485(+)
MECDVRQVQRAAARLSYALNALFVASEEVPSFSLQLKSVVEKVYKLLPDLQEIEVMGMIRRDQNIAGYLGILVEVVYELAELCREATEDSFLLSPSSLCIKHSEAIESLDSKLTWAFASMGYTGTPLLPRRGSIWAETKSHISTTCSSIMQQPPRAKFVIVTGDCRRTVSSRITSQLKSHGCVDHVIATEWVNTETIMTKVLLHAGMLHTSLTPHLLTRHVLHNTYTRCLNTLKVCIQLDNVPPDLVAPQIHDDIMKLLPSFRPRTVGRLVLVVNTQLHAAQPPSKVMVIRPPALTPSIACSLATMHVLDFLHNPSKMVLQRERLQTLVQKWECNPFLICVASSVIGVVAGNTNAATAAEREEKRRGFIGRMLDRLHEVEPQPNAVISMLLSLIPPPPIPGRDMQWLLSSLCEVFGGGTISVPTAAFILDVPLMHMLTALEQLKHIGFGAPAGEGVRFHSSTVDFIKACLPIEDATKNKLVSRHVVYQSWKVWRCRQECDLGNVSGGVDEYLKSLHSTRRAVRSGLRTKDPVILHLSLALILQCGWLEAEFLCLPISCIVHIALGIGASVQAHDPPTGTTGTEGDASDSENEELIDVPLDSPPTTPRVSLRPSKSRMHEPRIATGLKRSCASMARDILREGEAEEYWMDIGNLLDTLDMSSSADKRYLFTMAYDIVGYLLVRTRPKKLHKTALDAAMLAYQEYNRKEPGALVDLSSFCSLAPVPVADDPFIGQMADRLSVRKHSFAAWRSERHWHHGIGLARNILLQAECLSLLEAHPDAEIALSKLGSLECLKVNNALKQYSLHVTSSIRLRAVNYREALDDATQALSICRQLQPLCIKMLVRSLLTVVDINLEQGRYVDADRSLTKCLRLVTGKRKDSHVGILTPNDAEEYLSLLDGSSRQSFVLMCEVLSRLGRLLALLQRPHQAVVVCSRIREIIAECVSDKHPLYLEVLLCCARAHALLATDQNLGALKLLEEAEAVASSCYGDADECSLDIRLRISEHLLTIHDVVHAEIIGRKVLYVILDGSAWQGMNAATRDPTGCTEGWVAWWRQERRAGDGPAYQSDTHSSTLLFNTMRLLGKVRQAMGDAAVAGELTRAAYTMLGNMSMYTVQSTPLHPATPEILAQEADLLTDPREAVEVLNNAISVCRVLYGHRHVNVSVYLNEVGRWYARQKKYEAAYEAHVEALELAGSYVLRVNKCHRVKVPQEVGSDESSMSSTSTGGSGERGVQAVPGFPYVIVKGAVTPVHPYIASSLCCLGDVNYSLGKTEEGLHYHDSSLEVIKHLYTTESVPYTLGLLHVGNIFFSSAAYRKAEDVFRRALDISDRVMSDRHDAKPKILTALATTLERQGMFKGATGYYERALQCRQRVAFGSREEVAQAFHNLGINSYNMKDFAGARAYLESCLHFRRDAGFSETHPCVYTVLNWIAWVDHVTAHPEDWTLQRHDLPTSVSSFLASTITSITKSLFTPS